MGRLWPTLDPSSPAPLEKRESKLEQALTWGTQTEESPRTGWECVPLRVLAVLDPQRLLACQKDGDQSHRDHDPRCP